MATERNPESSFLVEQVEARLEQALDEQFTFKLFNELANTLRKHDNLRLAIQIYKKSLLSIKTRFKNEYLKMRDTSKILINIASTEFMQDEPSEALRYYEHALNVLKNTPDYPSITESMKNQLTPEQITLLADVAKVHVSIGHIQRTFGETGKAYASFSNAIECVERPGGEFLNAERSSII